MTIPPAAPGYVSLGYVDYDEPGPPCGVIDRYTGASCTRSTHARALPHRDESDPLTVIEWADGEPPVLLKPGT